jgi:hypothetical protein
MLEFLKDLNVTAAQVITFLVTIAVAYLAARWGARESRRQFEQKAEIEKRQAAVELVYPLMSFAYQCDQMNQRLNLDSISNQFDVVRGLKIPAECIAKAAVLGGEVAARVLKIFVLKDRIENTLSMDLFVGCPAESPESSNRFESWLTLLQLRARYAADLATKAAGLPVSHSQEQMDALLKSAMKYGHEIDSGDIERWE